MSEIFVLGADIGASNTRAGLWTPDGDLLDWQRGPTQIDDYDASIEWVCDTAVAMAAERGGVIRAASLAVAAEVIDGRLTKAEDLTPWLGNTPAADTEACLAEAGHYVVFSGADNDMVAIAKSQTGINADNNRRAEGTVVTWSSGYNAATYDRKGNVQPDEAGHEHLRPGAVCGCGADGHVGAHVSGNGISNNNGGVPMHEWLRDPANQAQIVTDMSTATIQMIERHRTDRGHVAEELRWIGGVTLGNPDLLFVRIAGNVRKELGPEAPAFEMVTMGDLAGMHGAAVAAREGLQRA